MFQLAGLSHHYWCIDLFVGYCRAQGELSPVSCTRPKDPTRAAPRGSTITMPQNFEFVDPCILGGTTLATPWSFWGPIALQPLTGFRDGKEGCTLFFTIYLITEIEFAGLCLLGILKLAILYFTYAILR